MPLRRYRFPRRKYSLASLSHQIRVDFHQAVFQCLYSQCHTAQLGSALHSALSECSSFEGPLELPLLIRQQGLQKREKRYPGSNSSATVRGSGFASASSMHSASYCHGSVSGLASPRTRSHGGSHSHAGSVPGFRTTASVKSTNVRTAMAISAPGFTATAY